jgi:hypothetical protein
MNQGGMIIGATRNGGNVFGGIEFAAWVFDPVTRETKAIGQAAALAASIRFNYPQAINERGQVVGGSDGDFWFYDPQRAGDGALIGLRDPLHGSGEFKFLSESGFVTGHAERGSFGSLGQSSWFYDPTTQLTTLLAFSVTSGGRSYTEVKYLGEDGTVIGEYDLYDGNTLRGRRSFYWSPRAGFHDLAALIGEELGSFDWDGFIERLVRVDARLIAGYARLGPERVAPIVLRLVPEPAAQLLALVAAACCARWTRSAGCKAIVADRSQVESV